MDLAEAHPNHQVTLVVFSDFRLFAPEPLRVLAELAAFPGQVHAVVLGDTSVDLADGNVTVTKIGGGGGAGHSRPSPVCQLGCRPTRKSHRQSVTSRCL